ncbi:MAG: caspase family protein [Fuerstiella sp.]
MKTSFRLYFTVVLIFLTAGSSVPMAGAAGPVVHAVIVGDTSPAAQWGKYVVNVTMDTTNMFSALTANLPQARCQVYPLTLEEDDWSTPENVLGQIQEVSLRPEDTFLFYFSGHGGADDRGHYFRLAGGKLYRSDVRAAMQKKGARLNVVLSDCCNVRGDGFAYFAPGIDDRSPSRPSPLFESLLLKPSGWVDVNASSPGEAAFFRKPPPPDADPFADPKLMPGSLFTSELTEFFQKRSNLSISWHDLIRVLSVDVHLAFRANYPRGAAPAKGLPAQTGQHVYAIEYPGMPEKSGPRTGLIVRDYQGRGALIATVPADSPGRRVYDVANQKYTALQAGQVVVAANETTVKSAADLVAAVQSSPQLMRLLVQDERGVATREYLLTLRY